MAEVNLRAVLRKCAGAADGPNDADLLDRFLSSGDEAAFELLLWRHSSLVFAVCRRVLRHDQDAEDAFQATFLALARKARTVSRGGAVGSWLYSVAYRVAIRAKSRAAHRPPLAPLPPDVPAPPTPPRPVWDEDSAVIDQEIARLPERYRVSFVLCHLEGLTINEAAHRLGCPRGTVGTRVARARERLRRRLASRGVGLAGMFLTAGVATPAFSRPSAELVARVIKMVRAGAGSAPAAVRDLTEGVLRSMILHKLKAGLAATVIVLALGASGVGLSSRAADPPTGTTPEVPAKAVAPPDRLTFPGWGTGVDPDGDCQFTVGKGILTIAVPGSDHVLGIERKKMNAPRVLQTVNGDFIIQVRVRGGFPKGAKTLVPDRRPVFVAGLLLYVEDGTYVRLERSELTAERTPHPYPNWELRQDGKRLRAGGTHDGVIDGAAPVWLRLERRGARVLGSHSVDGVKWTSLVPLTCKLPRRVQVGVSAGNNTTTPLAATFEGLQLFSCVAGGPPADDNLGGLDEAFEDEAFDLLDRLPPGKRLSPE